MKALYKVTKILLIVIAFCVFIVSITKNLRRQKFDSIQNKLIRKIVLNQFGEISELVDIPIGKDMGDYYCVEGNRQFDKIYKEHIVSFVL